MELLLSPPQAGASADRASPDPRDNSGIALMLKRLESSFNKKDLPGILSCFSDDAVTVFPIEHEGTVVGRQQLESFLAAGLQHPENEVAERVFIDATGNFTLNQNGDVAEMLLTHAVRVPSVRGTPAVIGFVSKDFATVCYKNGRWQICFMFPCFVESNAVVAEVVPGGQAEGLGIRTGDVITHHLRMPIVARW
jgi:ketosteroid isomerase-like protein